MKVKALIIGALPLPFVGPWVRIDDGLIWRVVHPPEAAGFVEVEVRNGWESHALSSNGESTEVSGELARAVLRQEIVGLRELSVTLEEVRP